MTTTTTTTTINPVTTDGWYQHTDGTFGHYTGAARSGSSLASKSYADYECVFCDEAGKIVSIGWPARSALAAAAGVDRDELTPAIAERALWKLRTLDQLKRRAVNELTRRVAGQGIDLTHEQADELGAEVLDWMRDRLELTITTDDEGVHAAPREVHCECGAWSGEPCQWTGPRSETVVIEFMPNQHRASHAAAGRRGLYPHNGAQRIRVERSCADRMLETDGEWCAIKVASHA